MDQSSSHSMVNPMIKELAIIDVQPGRNNRPDMFSALIKGHFKEVEVVKEFSVRGSFVRQGEWWLLNEIKG